MRITLRQLLASIPALALLAAASPALAAGPGELKFDQSSTEVLESAGVAVVVVERSRGEDGAVSVDYATSDGTAADGSDYTGVSGTLSWGPNDGTNRTFQVPILDDPDAEGVETINLTLSNPTGGAIIQAGRGTSVVVILANDAGGPPPPPPPPPPPGPGPGPGPVDPDAGVFKFDQRDFFAMENAGHAVVSVERSHGEDGAVSVDYAASAGTATPGADFTPVAGTLSWGPGDGSVKTFTVPLANDQAGEGSETVIVTLANPLGGAAIDAERGSAVLTILDDDQGTPPPPPPGNDDDRPGTLKFGHRSFQAIEGGDALVLVERSHGEGGTVSVDYAITAGSATAGSDYVEVAGTLTWGPGDGGIKTFVVPLLDDGVVEGNETAVLTLANPTGGAVIDAVRGEAPLTILDDDGSTAACAPSGSTLCLAGGRFQVEAGWRTPQGGAGAGGVIPVEGGRSGLVWFFNPSNIEMLVKVIDACRDFDRFWVFFSATTNVDFTLTVTDTATGIVKQYTNPLGRAAEPVQDTITFSACP